MWGKDCRWRGGCSRNSTATGVAFSARMKFLSWSSKLTICWAWTTTPRRKTSTAGWRWLISMATERWTLKIMKDSSSLPLKSAASKFTTASDTFSSFSIQWIWGQKMDYQIKCRLMNMRNSLVSLAFGLFSLLPPFTPHCCPHLIRLIFRRSGRRGRHSTRHQCRGRPGTWENVFFWRLILWWLSCRRDKWGRFPRAKDALGFWFCLELQTRWVIWYYCRWELICWVWGIARGIWLRCRVFDCQ